MRQRRGASAVAELRRYWEQWTSIVELFARQRRTRKHVDPEVYEAVYNDVLHACRSIASMLDGEEQVYFQDLEQLALPWVSTKSFEHTDRDILSDLLTRCRRAERELGGRARAFLDFHEAVRFLLSVTVAAGLIFLFWTTARAWMPILDHNQNWTEAVRISIDRTRYVHHLIIPGVLVVTVSSFMVSRTA